MSEAELSNAAGGRPTKNERREQAREQARLLREEARRRERRNKALLQGGIVVVVLAIVAGIGWGIWSFAQDQKPGMGPANMASGGVLLVSDGADGIKVQPTPALAAGADPVDSVSTAPIRIQEFIDLSCPICQSFEIGLDFDGDGEITQADIDRYNEVNGTSIAPDLSTLGDLVGNLAFIETLVAQGGASLEIFPVSILDRNWQGSAFATRAANAFAAIAAGDPDHLLGWLRAMFEQQPAEQSGPGLSDDQIVEIARGAGVDLAAQVETADGPVSLEAAIRGQSFKKWVAATSSRAANFGYSAEANVDRSRGFGTPVVVVNGQQYRPMTDYASKDEFHQFIGQLEGLDYSKNQTPSPSPAPTPAG